MTFKSQGADNLNDIISKFNSLSKEEKIKLVSYFLGELKRLNVSEQILFRKEVSVPIGIFANDLSSLEAVVKYLKEDLKLGFSKIGKLLNRSNKTIWATYHNTTRKMPSAFGDVSKEIMIPVSAMSNREFSALESVVGFIKNLDYSNHEVAMMLHLDDRTIWTVYARVKGKNGIRNE